jgi:hypothetical protein
MYTLVEKLCMDVSNLPSGVDEELCVKKRRKMTVLTCKQVVGVQLGLTLKVRSGELDTAI